MALQAFESMAPQEAATVVVKALDALDRLERASVLGFYRMWLATARRMGVEDDGPGEHSELFPPPLYCVTTECREHSIEVMALVLDKAKEKGWMRYARPLV